MFNNPGAQQVNLILIFPLLFRHLFVPNRARLFAIILIIVALFPLGCAIVKMPAPQKPYVTHEIESILVNLRNQQDKVYSFFSSGTVLVKGWIWKSEADILMAGERDPYRIKIEITHPWGTPILHLLIDKKRVEVLSFNEKRIYLGDFTPEALSKFLPETICDRNLIWSVLRGIPIIEEYHNAVSSEKNMIRLLNQEGKDIEVIGLSLESLLPEKIIFPEKSLELLFSGFKEKDGIYYAEEVTVNNIAGMKDLILKRKSMVLNKSISDQVFTLEKPPTFETVYMY